MRAVVHMMRVGDWLSHDHVQRWLRSLLLFEVVMFSVFVAGTHGLIVALSRPASMDFVSFYAAGRLTDVGTPWLAYDHMTHHIIEQQATEIGIPYNPFYYPPIFLLLCGILAKLPYLFAVMVFQAATLIPLLLAVRLILRGVSPVLLVAFPAVFWTVGTGQNAFLTAALFASATFALDRRPVVAGLLFGALCYKPHFGLLVPVALVGGGHWRVIAAAAFSSLTLATISLMLFGWQTWQAYLSAAIESQSVYTTHAIFLGGLTSPYGAVIVFGGSPLLAGVTQAVITSLIGCSVAVVWRRVRSLPIRAALLVAATPVAVPIVMFYDLMLVGVAMAWLMRAGRDDGFPPWSKTALALLFVMPLLSGNLGGNSHLLIAPSTAAGGLLLASVFAWRAFVADRV
jgi:alpha-1,2-mannosyltransferase